MKHSFLFIFLLLISSFSGYLHSKGTVEREEAFRINGKIDDANIETFVFQYYNCTEGISVVDTIPVINGAFTIEGIISPRTRAFLFMNDKRVYLYLDPGEMQLYLKKDSLESFVLKGSQTQKDRENIDGQTRPWDDYLSKIETQLSSEQIEQNKDLLIRTKDSINNLLANSRIDFISSHPSSYYSLDLIFSLLSNKNQNADVLISLFDGLSENVRTSCSGKEIHEFILQREISTQSNVSSFDALDKDGTLVKLSDFEGKYILIDFWASWCGHCIKGFPHLKELYAKYKDKGLVIIFVSTDYKKDKQEWLDAIEKYDIAEWIQVLSCENVGENNFCKLIETPSPIPHYIVIDKSGNIIKHWSGFNDAIAKEQDEMFEDIFENKK